MIVNKKQLADILGKTERTLTLWQKEGLPALTTGRKGQGNEYDTSTVIKWLISREIGNESSYDVERTRLTRLQADKTALEIATLTRELIGAEEAELAWSELVAAFRSRMLSIPTKLAYQIVSLQDLHAVQSLLEDSIHEALTELKEYPDVFGKNKNVNKKIGKSRRSASTSHHK